MFLNKFHKLYRLTLLDVAKHLKLYLEPGLKDQDCLCVDWIS